MHIRDILMGRSALSLALGVGLGLANVGAAAAQAPTPQRKPSTPVEALERALKMGKAPDKVEPEKRRQAITEAVARITSFGDAAQALKSYEWGFEDSAPAGELEIRKRLLDRFLAGVEAVTANGSPSAQSALATLLGEFAVDVRSAAITSARAPAVQQSFPELAKALSRLAIAGNPRVREAALRALGKVRAAPDDTAKALEAALKDGSAPVEVRRAAADTLSVLIRPVTSGESTAGVRQGTATGNQDADVADFGREIVRSAVHGLNDSDAEVRRRSLSALEQVASTLIKFLRLGESSREGLNVDPKQEQLVPEVVSAVLRAVPAVTPSLSGSDPAMRLLAARTVEAAGEIQQRWQTRKEKPPTVEPKADDKRTGRSRGGLTLVVAAQDDGPSASADRRPLIDAVGPLIAALGDSDVRVRLAAADALDAIATKVGEAAPQKDLAPETLVSVGQALTRALGDVNHFVRWSAARTLGKIGPVDGVKGGAVAALARSLCDPDQDVRRAAAEALEHYGADAAGAVAALTRTVNEGDAEVRHAAMRALVAVGKDAAPAVSALAQALGDSNPRLRRAAAEALSKFAADIGPAEEALHRALADSDSEVRRHASDALLKERQLPK